MRLHHPLALLLLAAPSLGQAATQANGEAVSVRVTVQALGASALDSGPIPSGAAAAAPTDHEIHAEAASASIALGQLARIAAGPLSARVRALLGRELSESSAATQSLEIVIGDALTGVLLTLDGAASTSLGRCAAPSAGAQLDAVLDGAEITVLGSRVALSSHAAPNTEVPLSLPGARLVLNEQRVVDGVAEVAALHLVLDDALIGGTLPRVVDADVVVARSRTALAGCGAYADQDADGLRDDTDNCVTHANPGQRDTDADGAGDACDLDDDADLVLDGADTCPLEANPAQGTCPDAIHADGFE